MVHNRWTVEETGAGDRLDRYCTVLLPEWSRSQIQRAIRSGEMTINDAAAVPHVALKAGDVIALSERAPVAQSPFVPPTVISEEGDVLVIEKPSGLLVHPVAHRIPEPSVASWIAEVYPDVVEAFPGSNRPGIVHRLDRDVSGVMLIARTQDALALLQRQFRERTIQKVYTGLIYGNISAPEGTLTFAVGRGRHGHMAARPADSPDDRFAETAYELDQRYEHFDLLRLIPKTGRTHQIRVHLHARGHPIVGDPIYHPRHPKHRIAVPRIFLHAFSITYRDSDGREQAQTSPLPKELTDVLARLKPASV